MWPYFAWLPALLLLALAPLRSLAQEPEIRTIPFEGPEFFCHILHHENIKPITSFKEAEAEARKTILIVLGDPRLLHENKFLKKGRLKQFLDGGGTVLIATDYPLELPGLGLTIADARVQQEKGGFHGQQECPLLSLPIEILPGLDPGNDHPLFQLLGKGIATNRPSYIKITQRPQPRHALLDFPFAATIHDGGGRRQILFSVPYMVGAPKNSAANGRLLLIAGHGMFINGMMAQSNCDNFEFTVNAVRWLREQANGGKRGRALLVVDGEIVTNFDMKLTPGPPPIPMPTVQAINRLLRGWEREGFIPKLVAELLGDYMGRFIGILLVLTTFGIIVYGAKKFMEARAHIESGVPIMVGMPAPPKTGDPLEERSQARLRKRDYGSDSRQLGLEWLREQFDVTPDRWRHGVHAEFHVQGYFWPPWKLRRQAAFVLRLARGDGLPWVSRHEFFLLAEALRDLTAAMKEGRLALLVEGKNVRQI